MKALGVHTVIRFLRSIERVTSRKALHIMLFIVLPILKPLLSPIGKFFIGLLQLIADHAGNCAKALEEKYYGSTIEEDDPEDDALIAGDEQHTECEKEQEAEDDNANSSEC